MNTNSDRLDQKWSRMREQLKNIVLNTPELLPAEMWKILPDYQDICSTCTGGFHSSFLTSPCAQVYSLCTEYKIGSPHQRPVYQGFFVNSGVFRGNILTLRKLNQGAVQISIQKVSFGYRCSADPGSYQILTKLMLEELIAEKNLLTQFLIGFRCGTKNYLLEKDTGQTPVRPADAVLDQASRQVLLLQLDQLFQELTPFQWYEPDLTNSIYFKPYPDLKFKIRDPTSGLELQSSYSLIYQPSSLVEFKIRLARNNQDLWFCQNEFSSLQTDYQTQKLTLRSKIFI